jgi:hypothetical protein
MNMPKDTPSSQAQKHAERIAAAAEQWVTSPEGQRAVESGLARARDTSAQFSESQRVDPDILHKPVTV